MQIKNFFAQTILHFQTKYKKKNIVIHLDFPRKFYSNYENSKKQSPVGCATRETRFLYFLTNIDRFHWDCL
jgi:hypothetical protein